MTPPFQFETLNSGSVATLEPWVDVLIPVRNGGTLLGEAIASVLRQTMPWFRLIIVNNNSTDQTATMARSFADPRVEVIDHSSTRSLFENVNFCLTQVRAPFFCILHADDRLLPEYLEIMLPRLREQAEAQIAVCQVRNIDANGKVIPNLKYRLKNWVFLSIARTFQADDVSGRLLVAFNFMPAPTLMYRQKVIEYVGIFREDMSFLSDLEYLDRGLRRGGRYLVVPRVLFEYRLHAEQATSSLTRNLHKYTETLGYFTEQVPVGPVTSRMTGRLAQTAAEARVAVVILWDYITSGGSQATAFRGALVQYMLITPILDRYAWFWRLLDPARVGSLFVRRLLCAATIAFALGPLVVLGLFR